MKIVFEFHKIDRNNSMEFLKTSFIGIVAQWFMGLKNISKYKILHGKNHDLNENVD